MDFKDLYETDYELWLNQQIDALQTKQWSNIDVDNLIEELEGLNRSNKRELYSYTVVLLAHLLKWQYQPLNRSGSWKGSIGNSRKQIKKLFKDQPSLKNHLTEICLEAYDDAKEWAHQETQISLTLFPTECPYSFYDMLDSGFFPD